MYGRSATKYKGQCSFVWAVKRLLEFPHALWFHFYDRGVEISTFGRNSLLSVGLELWQKLNQELVLLHFTIMYHGLHLITSRRTPQKSRSVGWIRWWMTSPETVGWINPNVFSSNIFFGICHFEWIYCWKLPHCGIIDFSKEEDA